MPKMWSMVGASLALVLTVNARSLTPVDVPDPPKASHYLTKDLLKDAHHGINSQELLEAFCKEACAAGVVRPECNCQKDETKKLCTLACQLTQDKDECECTIVTDTTDPLKAGETHIIISEKIVLSLMKTNVQDKVPIRGGTKEGDASTTTVAVAGTVTTTPRTTTTLDPLTEFCKEACQEGIGGPECDCADHPIG